MTNADLIALLREAREMLDKGSRSSWDTEVVGELAWTRNRIDAALAGRAEGSTKDVVEWTKGASEDDYAYAQPSRDTYVTVAWLDGGWRWSTRRVQGCNGTCATEAEAKAAAVAAARGL
jgi:hypothetical protein